MKLVGLIETKLFHFHVMFMKNYIKSAKLPHTSIHTNPFPEIMDPPLISLFRLFTQRKTYSF